MTRSGFHAALTDGEPDTFADVQTWSLCRTCGKPTNYRNLCECHNGTVSETLAFFNSIDTCPECLRPNTDHAPGCYNSLPFTQEELDYMEERDEAYVAWLDANEDTITWQECGNQFCGGTGEEWVSPSTCTGLCQTCYGRGQVPSQADYERFAATQPPWPVHAVADPGPPVITCDDCGAEHGAHDETCMPGKVE